MLKTKRPYQTSNFQINDDNNTTSTSPKASSTSDPGSVIQISSYLSSISMALRYLSNQEISYVTPVETFAEISANGVLIGSCAIQGSNNCPALSAPPHQHQKDQQE